jgi:hypothetical protein
VEAPATAIVNAIPTTTAIRRLFNISIAPLYKLTDLSLTAAASTATTGLSLWRNHQSQGIRYYSGSAGHGQRQRNTNHDCYKPSFQHFDSSLLYINLI